MATGLAEVYAARRKEVQERQLDRRLEKAKEVIGTYRALIKKASSACRLILAQLETTAEELGLGEGLRDTQQAPFPPLETLEAASKLLRRPGIGQAQERYERFEPSSAANLQSGSGQLSAGPGVY